MQSNLTKIMSKRPHGWVMRPNHIQGESKPVPLLESSFIVASPCRNNYRRCSRPFRMKSRQVEKLIMHCLTEKYILPLMMQLYRIHHIMSKLVWYILWLINHTFKYFPKSAVTHMGTQYNRTKHNYFLASCTFLNHSSKFGSDILE